MKKQDLWHLEEQFWTGDSDFYEQHLATDALMVFPKPAGVMDRPATLESIQSGGRWNKVEITDKRLIKPAQDTAILVYSVNADRGNSDTAYAAQCSSTYVSTSGGWQLAVHQQTPTD